MLVFTINGFVMTFVLTLFLITKKGFWPMPPLSTIQRIKITVIEKQSWKISRRRPHHPVDFFPLPYVRIKPWNFRFDTIDDIPSIKSVKVWSCVTVASAFGCIPLCFNSVGVSFENPVVTHHDVSRNPTCLIGNISFRGCCADQNRQIAATNHPTVTYLVVGSCSRKASK